MADLYGANSLKEEALRHLVANRKEEVVKAAIRETLQENPRLMADLFAAIEIWIREDQIDKNNFDETKCGQIIWLKIINTRMTQVVRSRRREYREVSFDRTTLRSKSENFLWIWSFPILFSVFVSASYNKYMTPCAFENSSLVDIKSMFCFRLQAQSIHNGWNQVRSCGQLQQYGT